MSWWGERRQTSRLGDEVTSQMQVIQSIADKESNFIIETRKLFSLLWKNLEAHCFRSLAFSVSKQCKTAKTVSFRNLPNIIAKKNELPDFSK